MGTKRKIVSYLLLLFFLGSCFTRSHVMNRTAFDDIHPGESITEVQKKVGDPYTINKKSKDAQEYEYIERIPMGDEIVEENHYFLTVKDGQVVSKRLSNETPPAYDLINEDDPNDTDLQ